MKATVCIDGGVLGEAEISYAGPNAAARARLAAETIAERMHRRAPGLKFRTDAIGVVSVLGDDGGTFVHGHNAAPADVRLRFAAQSSDAAAGRTSARRGRGALLRGSGRRRRRPPPRTPRLASASCLIERSFVQPTVTMLGGGA